MKKSLLVLTAALTFGSIASAQTPATASAPQVPALTDVPAGHWAKDAIDRLVSRGIILGYPDGTFRGTQNLTRYEAAIIIARLLDQINTGAVAAPTGGDLTALQNAVQELAADLAALGVRVSDLEANAVSKDDFTRLESRVEALGAANGNPEALAALQARIDDLATRADQYDTIRADVDDNANSIAALNDLTVLLNQDILDLQDRVSAVEAAQADFVQRSDFNNLSTKVTAIDTRVSTLEKAPKFSVGGQIDGAFGRIALVKGNENFDITRLTAGTGLAGVFDVKDVAKVTKNTEMPYDYLGTGVRFGIKASNLSTTNGAIVANNASINFRTGNPWVVAGKASTDGSIKLAEPYVFVNDASVDGTIAEQKFKVLYHSTLAEYKFQNYLFNNTNETGNLRGIVATINATKLPGSPDLTIVAGNIVDATVEKNPRSTNYWGVRGGYNTSVGKFGVAYAQFQDIRAALGADMNLKVGPVNLLGEAVVSVPSVADNQIVNPNNNQNAFQNAWKNADKAGYIEGRVDLGVAKFGANYRAVAPNFKINNDKNGGGALTNAAMSAKKEYPYAANQVGYGAAVGTNFGPLALGAYVDRQTTWDNKNPQLGFGVKAGAKLGAFEAVGFYNNFKLDTTAVDGVNIGNETISDGLWTGSDYDNNKNGAGMGIAGVPFGNTSTFGGQISHDGKAGNALVKGLNFTIGDAYYNISKTNSLYAYGDYSTTIAGITVNPLLRYRMVSNTTDAHKADGNGKYNNYNFTTMKYGVKLAMAPMTTVPFEPSLYGNVVGRNTNYKGAKSEFSTQELLAQVGVGVNNFLAQGISAKVGYSTYTGKNVADILFANADYDGWAFDSSVDQIYANRAVNGKGVKVNGIFAQLGWSGLTANYGVFNNTSYATDAAGKISATDSVAQAFKVNYTFKF